MLTPTQLDNLRVVLVAPRNPLNIGAVARAMSNFGFTRLRVVNPYEVAFREAQSAVGAAELLASAEEFSSVAEAVADCTLAVGTTAGHNRELRQPLRVLAEAAKDIRARMFSAPTAVLFGSEKRGLSNDDLGYCHWLLHIPTRDVHLSMNLGQAVAVCLYELIRANEPNNSVDLPVRATGAELERVTAVLLEALYESGYVNPIAAAAAEGKIRRMVRRLELSHEDAETMLGMLGQIVWKLKNGAIT